MSTTLSTYAERDRFVSARLDFQLHRRLIAEAICMVDRSDLKRLQNPFGADDTAAQMTAITGEYTIPNSTTTDDTLTVDQEVKVPKHVYDFEEVLGSVEMFQSRIDEMIFKAKEAVDQFVLNNLAADAGQTYNTPAGNFGTVANINEIIADCNALVAGFAEASMGTYLAIENTETSGLMQAQMINGFSFADAALRNGMLSVYGGTEIYVTRAGTFVDATVGTRAFTNANNRVFGVKGMTTYATPRDFRYEEKPVSGKTGMELLVLGYVGHKVWSTKADLTVNVTLTA